MGGERLLIRYPNNPVPEQIVIKKTVPTGWDKTKVLSGAEFITKLWLHLPQTLL
jgi:hypothetical protein